MKLASAKSEATAKRRKAKDAPTSVEDLNPRGQIVKSAEMTVRRAQMLSALCRQHLDLCEGDIHRAKRETPAVWGSLDVRKMKKQSDGAAPVNPRKLLHDIWGDTWYVHPEYLAWSDLFEQWWDGGLEDQIDGLLFVLPEAVRSKYQ